MKILHVVDSLNIGGLENGLVNLINHSSGSFRHVVCCLREVGPMADRIEKPDVTIHLLGKKSRDYLLSWKIRSIIKSEMPDIVHTRNWGTIDGVLAARMAGVKKVVHGEHGRDHDDAAGSNIKRNLFRRFLSFNIRRFVTVSADLNDWLVKVVGINADKVTTIINGVDTEKFKPLDTDKRDAKLKLGFDPDELLLGSVGRLDKMKNYPLFIAALAQLKNSGFRFKGVIVGEGAQRQTLENLIAQTGAPVSLVGKRHDVGDYLNAFDLFVLPSINEGISNTILEAMACGLPVIATRVGGNPELLIDGVSGCLVESNDLAGLVDAIEPLLKDRKLRTTLGQRAREHCCEKFSLQRMVGEYEKLYGELTGEV